MSVIDWWTSGEVCCYLRLDATTWEGNESSDHTAPRVMHLPREDPRSTVGYHRPSRVRALPSATSLLKCHFTDRARRRCKLLWDRHCVPQDCVPQDPRGTVQAFSWPSG
ncbi:hypothetical protein VTO73DRAFT_12821 [Trametes versicolor]